MDELFPNWTGHGSLTKEPPLEKLERALEVARPGMPYNEFLTLVARDSASHPDAPGLVIKRFLALDENGAIASDGVLAAVDALGASDPKVRKMLYLIWALRDNRIRGFVKEIIADGGGIWVPGQLQDKSNAAFFEEYLNEDSAAKARSNYEYYLDSAGIVPLGSNVVNLALADGYYADALQVAANYASDSSVKAQLTSDPLAFIVEHELNALLNARLEDLEALSYGGGNDGADLPGPSGGGAETTVPAPPTTDWEPPEKGDAGSGQGPTKGTGTRSINLVALERSNAAHQELEQLTAKAISAQGGTPKRTAQIDMLHEQRGGTAVYEMKSCHQSNLHAQVRKGVSQLLEYRYTHKEQLKEPVVLALVLETKPIGEKAWLIPYLTELGITPVWKDGNQLVTTQAEVSELLDGVIVAGGE